MQIARPYMNQAVFFSATWNSVLLPWRPSTAESFRPSSRRNSSCWSCWTDRITWSVCWRENWPAPLVTAHCSNDSRPHSLTQCSSYWLWLLTVTVSAKFILSKGKLHMTSSVGTKESLWTGHLLKFPKVARRAVFQKDCDVNQYWL